MKKLIAIVAIIILAFPFSVNAQTVVPTETPTPTPTETPMPTPDLDTTPPVISNIGVSSITQSSAKITWKTDESTIGFLDYGQSTSYGQSVGGNDYITNHMVSLSGLKPGTKYNFKIYATDSSGNEISSPNQTFTTSSKQDGEVDSTPVPTSSVDSSALLPPGNLSFQLNQEGDKFSVSLDWEESKTEDIEGYKVYRSKDDEYSPEEIATIPPDTLNYTDESVEKDVKYYYYVRSYKDGDESVDSNVVAVEVGQEGSIAVIPKIVTGDQENFWVNLAGLNLMAGGVLAIGYLIGKFGEKILLKKKNSKLIQAEKVSAQPL
jgi:hypothetical protein